MPILKHVHISKHAMQRANERLYKGITAKAVLDLVKGKYAITRHATAGTRKPKRYKPDTNTYIYQSCGLTFVFEEHRERPDEHVLLTLFWGGESDDF